MKHRHPLCEKGEEGTGLSGGGTEMGRGYGDDLVECTLRSAAREKRDFRLCLLTSMRIEEYR